MYRLFFNTYIEIRNLQFDVPGISISETPTLHYKYYTKLPKQHVCSTQHSCTDYLSCQEGEKLSTVITCTLLEALSKIRMVGMKTTYLKQRKNHNSRYACIQVDLSGSFPNFYQAQ